MWMLLVWMLLLEYLVVVKQLLVLIVYDMLELLQLVELALFDAVQVRVRSLELGILAFHCLSPGQQLNVLVDQIFRFRP